MDMAYVYILKGMNKEKYYVGSTNDLVRRLKEHQQGKVMSTKFMLPLELAFKKECLSLSEARKAELKIKKWKRKDFVEKVIMNQRLEFKN